MQTYQGIFPYWSRRIEAESESDAQQKLREMLLKEVAENAEPFVIDPYQPYVRPINPIR